jgi:Flp pilus assembly protein TadB
MIVTIFMFVLLALAVIMTVYGIANGIAAVNMTVCVIALTVMGLLTGYDWAARRFLNELNAFLEKIKEERDGKGE